MRPYLCTLLLCACGGGGGGTTEKSGTSGSFDPTELFTATRYVQTVAKQQLRSDITIVLDTAMDAASLAEAAQSVSAWVDARATDYRFSLVEADDVCGSGHVRVALPAGPRDLLPELRATATAVMASVANVAPAARRSTLGALKGQASSTPKRQHFVMLITQGSDGCGADTAVVDDLRRANVRTAVVAYRPDPAAHEWLSQVAVKGGFAAQCQSPESCGTENACVDWEKSTCERTYFRETTPDGLTQWLLHISETLPPGPKQCRVWFDLPKKKQTVTRVFVNGADVKGEWTAEVDPGTGGVSVTFSGAACDTVDASDPFAPAIVEIEVPFSLGL